MLHGLTKINSLPSTLVQLVVSKCHLTYIVAENISKMSRINDTLKFDISENSDGLLVIVYVVNLHVNAVLIQSVACIVVNFIAKVLKELL